MEIKTSNLSDPLLLQDQLLRNNYASKFNFELQVTSWPSKISQAQTLNLFVTNPLVELYAIDY